MTEDEARAWVACQVSRETLAQLETYTQLVQKWQPTINLVSRNTLDQMYSRHIGDSLQILELRHGDSGHWLDLGSGAGFPGLICAIVAKTAAPGLHFTLIESDQRKSSFLREVARQTQTDVTVITTRIEEATAQDAQIISARALAPLEKLCDFSASHLGKGGICLFPKGRNHIAEQPDADRNWTMDREIIPSKMDSDSVIYRIGNLTRV